MRSIIGALAHPRTVMVAAVSLFAVFAIADHVTWTPTKETPVRVVATCLPEQSRTQLWLRLRPDLHPTPGSPAAFRLADERSSVIWAYTRPDLQPAAGSPAAFRLAEQRSLVAATLACLYE
jgi:hypothetical protein